MKLLSYTFLVFLIMPFHLETFAQWEPINGVTTERLFATYSINNQHALIGGKDGVLFRTNDGGETWSAISVTGEDISDIQFMDDNTGFMAAGPSIFKTTDGGNTWISSSVSTNDDLVSVSFPTDQTGYACSEGGEVIKTTDGGNNWQILNTVGGPGFSAISFGDENTGVMVGASGTILQTTDGGATWQDIDAGLMEDLNDVCFSSATNAYLVGGQGMLMHSANGGADWSNQVSLTVSDLNAICFIDEEHGYVAGRDGVIVYTTNGGELWNSETPVTTERLLDIHFSDAGSGYAVGREGVILRHSVATAINDWYETQFQVSVSPNPVVEKGSFKIQNYDGLPWQIEIMDLSGSKMMEFTHIKGREYRFSAAGLRSGIYLYTIKSAAQNTITGKFIIL